MKAYRRFGKQMVMMVLMAIIAAHGGCAKKKPTTATRAGDAPSVIELGDDSKLADALREGDIPEEDRGALPWLPQRPPSGMQFQASSELQTIYFEYDKFSLTGESRDLLNQNTAWLKSHPDVSVQLAGHCDERGSLEYNQVLGENRAIATKKYLIMLGIASDRIFTISYGETKPAVQGQTEDAWAQNRRVEFGVSQ